MLMSCPSAGSGDERKSEGEAPGISQTATTMGSVRIVCNQQKQKIRFRRPRSLGRRRRPASRAP